MLVRLDKVAHLSADSAPIIDSPRGNNNNGANLGGFSIEWAVGRYTAFDAFTHRHNGQILRALLADIKKPAGGYMGIWPPDV
jgi:hypothetical protein